MLATTFSLSKHTCLEKKRAAALHSKAQLKSRRSIKREAEARSGSCTLPAAEPGARLVLAQAVPKPLESMT